MGRLIHNDRKETTVSKGKDLPLESDNEKESVTVEKDG
jgi:hypothetical protein